MEAGVGILFKEETIISRTKEGEKGGRTNLCDKTQLSSSRMQELTLYGWVNLGLNCQLFPILQGKIKTDMESQIASVMLISSSRREPRLPRSYRCFPVPETCWSRSSNVRPI